MSKVPRRWRRTGRCPRRSPALRDGVTEPQDGWRQDLRAGSDGSTTLTGVPLVEPGPLDAFNPAEARRSAPSARVPASTRRRTAWLGSGNSAAYAGAR
jgi:hypothetical protein